MVYDSKLKSRELDMFCRALLCLENEEECYRFLEDIATVAEINSMAQRFQVARMLAENETYNAISEMTGASTATISRVKRSLNYGADGYKLVLAKLSK